MYQGSAAERAGLAAGDTLIAIEGLAVDAGSLHDLLKRYANKGEVDVHYFRLGVLAKASLPVVTADADTAYLSLADEAKAKRWLDSTLQS